MRRKPYPRNRDVREAILEVLGGLGYVRPEDFPERVRSKLEEKGFFTGLLTTKRVWRAYEEMVGRGEIYDVLGVVSGKGSLEGLESEKD